MSLRFGDFPSIILTLDSVVRQRGSGHHFGGTRLDRSRAVAPADRPSTNSPLPFAAPDINQRHRPAIPVDGAPGFSGRCALQQALPRTRTQAAGDEGGCGGAMSAARWRRQIWKVLIFFPDRLSRLKRRNEHEETTRPTDLRLLRETRASHG